MDTETIHVSEIVTPLGMMQAGFVADQLALLNFVDESSFLSFFAGRHNLRVVREPSKNAALLQEQMDAYFNRDRQYFDLPYILLGTKFQKEVWQFLAETEYGKTYSYSDQASYLKNPKAVRAIASSNGKNPISIVIPCHRIISKSGKIGGYTGGVWRKKTLLHIENPQLY